MRRTLALALLALSLVGCQTVTMRPTGTNVIASSPDFSKRVEFYWWGLTPDKVDYDIGSICRNGDISQIQTTHTAEDALFGLITIGIYSPRHIQVWCQNGKGK